MGIQAQIAIIIIMDYRQQNNANTECFLYILNVFQLIRVIFIIVRLMLFSTVKPHETLICISCGSLFSCLTICCFYFAAR